MYGRWQDTKIINLSLTACPPTHRGFYSRANQSWITGPLLSARPVPMKTITGLKVTWQMSIMTLTRGISYQQVFEPMVLQGFVTLYVGVSFIQLVQVGECRRKSFLAISVG